jgi:hypothetical protein
MWALSAQPVLHWPTRWWTPSSPALSSASGHGGCDAAIRTANYFTHVAKSPPRRGHPTAGCASTLQQARARRHRRHTRVLDAASATMLFAPPSSRSSSRRSSARRNQQAAHSFDIACTSEGRRRLLALLPGVKGIQARPHPARFLSPAWPRCLGHLQSQAHNNTDRDVPAIMQAFRLSRACRPGPPHPFQ